MLVIVVAVITQGFRVPSESRGEVKSILFANSGFFQAVGVISFGKLLLSVISVNILMDTAFVCRMYYRTFGASTANLRKTTTVS